MGIPSSRPGDRLGWSGVEIGGNAARARRCGEPTASTGDSPQNCQTRPRRARALNTRTGSARRHQQRRRRRQCRHQRPLQLQRRRSLRPPKRPTPHLPLRRLPAAGPTKGPQSFSTACGPDFGERPVSVPSLPATACWRSNAYDLMGLVSFVGTVQPTPQRALRARSPAEAGRRCEIAAGRRPGRFVAVGVGGTSPKRCGAHQARCWRAARRQRRLMAETRCRRTASSEQVSVVCTPSRSHGR